MKKYRLALADVYFHVFYLTRMPRERLDIVAIAGKEHGPDSVFFNPGPTPRSEAERLGVRLYDDAAEMLDKEDAEIVGVCGVASDNYRIVVEALNRNRHVIVDKDICTSLNQLEAIQAAATSSQGTLAMILPMTQAPIVRKLKEIIDSGRIGDVVAVRSRRAYVQKVSKRPKWFYTKQHGGGILADIGIHDADVVRYLIGKDFLDVSARAINGRIRQFETAEDYSSAIFRMEGDIIYSVTVDRISPLTHRGDPSSIEVFGTKGQAIAPAGYQQLVVTTDDAKEPEVVEGFAEQEITEFTESYLDCLDRGDTSAPFFAPGCYNTVAGMLTAQKSADDGGVKITV